MITNISEKKGPRTLHLNNENNLQNVEENNYECTSVRSGNDDAVMSRCYLDISLSKFYETSNFFP